MILKRIAFFLEQIYRHLSYISNCLEKLVESNNRIDKKMGEPSGRVTFGGEVEIDKREAQLAFRDRRTVEVDAVKLEFEFDQNLFLGIDPRMNAKIEELLDSAQLNYLKETMEALQQMNDLVALAREKRDELIESSKKTQELLKVDLTALIEARSEEDKKKLETQYRDAVELKAQVRDGLKKLDEACERTKAMQAEADNTVKASGPVNRSISMKRA